MTNKRKIISIIGARPQFIKAAIVSQKILGRNMEEIIVHTGQHYDFNMSDVFFKELNIAEPGYFLGVGSGNHGRQTGRMLEAIETVLLKENPGVVLVYGDTNTTLAGALAAVKLHIPVAHVEAGLRSFNREMPEEINRVLTDHAADILFSPTETGLINLDTEGLVHIFRYKEEGQAFPPTPLPRPLAVDVGDVMYDIALEIKKHVDEAAVLKRWNLARGEFILTTVHRAENTDSKEKLMGICRALTQLAQSGKTVFFPVHPRTRKVLDTLGLLKDNLPGNLILADPVSYMEMVALESNARLIITDSGGVQKEGYFFGTPCIIVREQTEWVELVNVGWTMLTGADTEKITGAVSGAWEKEFKKEGPAIFGDGNASGRMVEILESGLDSGWGG